MYIIIFETWRGKVSEIWHDFEEAKERYWKLKKVYTEVYLFKAEEISM